ncbi:DNA cytosine methyltransferase [Streptomyces sp. NPDC059411]|uniref:DNA cytosine methyltransferase n=1 Tax=Streptomyces sp. NPDC059411 TaxID=3346825 RepID=UPI0036BE7306
MPVAVEDVVEEQPDFPGVLEDGESAEHMGAGVWRVTYREGFTYELTPCWYSVKPGQYGVGRVLEDGDVRGWSAIFDNQDMTNVMKWTRKESQTLAETHAFQAKYGHLHGKGYEDAIEVPFALELVVTELEPGRVWQVSRFGRSGVLVLQGWGYALLSETGDFPETPNRKYIDGKRWGYAIWCVVGGLRDFPTSRLRPVAVDHSGEACVVFGHDAGQSCESGRRNKSFPRFTVEVTGEDGAVVGTVPMCAKCWAGRAMADGDEFYNRRSATAAHLLSEGKGTWVDWQDRSEDLTGELISAALDAGAGLPDVRRALYLEALAEGDQRAAKTARAAAAKGGARKAEADAVRDRVLVERAAAVEELINWAEAREVAWSEWCDLTREMERDEREEHPFVPPVKPGPSVEVEADVVTYDGEDDDQEQSDDQGNEERAEMGRGSLAPKRKTVAARVGDIEFQKRGGKVEFPCVATLLGHAYVVRKLAGSFSAQHEHSDGARLVFEGEDPKGICRTGGDMFPNLPALKRSILHDATSRGMAEPVAEEKPEPLAEDVSNLPRPLRLALEREAAEESCEECEQAPCECYDPDAKERAPEPVESEAVKRFPELASFLEPRPEGAPMVVLNLFSGPGGMVIGLRDVLRQQLGRDVEIINIDNDADCVATLRAAGFLAIQADVTSLDPSDPVFREVRGLIVTPPCTDFTDSGKRAGRLPENVDILCGAFDSARRAGGFIPFGDGHDVAPDFGVEVSYKEPNGLTWDEVRADLEGYTGQTGGLMLEVAVWSLGLQAAGAPLEWVAVEQSSRLPEEIRGEVIADFQLSAWGTAEWHIADAYDYGSPTQRVRALLVARRDGHSGVSMEAPGLRTGAATATGLPEGTQVFTRGVGKRSGGGNVVVVSDERPYTAFTSRIRSVDVGEKGGRFTLTQIMRLIAIPETYPVQGSRTSVCQQIGDVVCPLVAAALLGAALGMEWLPHLFHFLCEQYPAVHRADTEEISAPLQTPAGEPVEADPVEMWEEEGGHVPGVDTPRALPVICGAHGLFMPKVRTLAAIEKQVRHEMAYRVREDGHRSRLARKERRAAHEMLKRDCNGERTDLTGYGKTRHGNADPTPPAVREGESIKPMNPGWAQEWWLFADIYGYGFEVSHRGGKWTALARLDEWQTEDGKVSLPGKLVRVAKEPCATAEELLNLCRAVGERRAVQDAATRMVRRVLDQPAEAVTMLPTICGDVLTLTVPVAEPVAPVLPSAGRGYWEIGERVIFEGRHGSVKSAKNGKTLVMMDDGNGIFHEHIEPRDLVAERYVVCGDVMMPTMPEKPKPVAVDPRLEWMAYERRAVAEQQEKPEDPRIAWMDYAQPEPEKVDVLAELRAELEAIRTDVDRWGSEIAALAVAEAERVVREVAEDMRRAELLALREEAKELREGLGWGPITWETVPTRARPWRAAWGLAASVAGVAGAGWVEGWSRGLSS